MKLFVAIVLIAIALAYVEARGGGGGGHGGRFGGHGGWGGGGYGFGGGYGWGGYGGYGYGGYGYGGLGYYNPYSYYGSPYMYGKRELISPFAPQTVWRTIPSVSGLVGLCRLMTSASIISCLGPQNLVECPVVFNSTWFNTTAFGLGKIPTMNYTTTPIVDQQFFIFPRSVDNTKWLNSSTMFNNTWYNLTLHTTKSVATCGIRVVDSSCFANLSTIFSAINVEDSMFAAIQLF